MCVQTRCVLIRCVYTREGVCTDQVCVQTTCVYRQRVCIYKTRGCLQYLVPHHGPHAPEVDGIVGLWVEKRGLVYHMGLRSIV